MHACACVCVCVWKSQEKPVTLSSSQRWWQQHGLPSLLIWSCLLSYPFQNIYVYMCFPFVCFLISINSSTHRWVVFGESCATQLSPKRAFCIYENFSSQLSLFEVFIVTGCHLHRHLHRHPPPPQLDFMCTSTAFVLKKPIRVSLCNLQHQIWVLWNPWKKKARIDIYVYRYGHLSPH